MNLDFSDDQKEVQAHAARLLAAKCSPSRVRDIMDAEAGWDEELWRSLAEFGALGAAIPERYGGSGLGAETLCVIAEELGRALAPVPVESSVFLVTQLLLRVGSEAQKRAWLPKLASGAALGSFALCEAPGPIAPGRLTARVARGRLQGAKRPVWCGAHADLIIVAARQDDDEIGLYITEPGAVRSTALESIDPCRSMAHYEFDNVAVEPLAEGDGVWGTIEQVLNEAAVLIAFEQIGGAERTLEIACSYARERAAFGRTIGSFQAVKHKLANMYAAIVIARANAYHGALALSGAPGELPVGSAMARLAATRAYLRCAKDNIQIHGASGFVWSSECHLHYRRAMALGLAIEAAPQWQGKLISRMRDARARALR